MMDLDLSFIFHRKLLWTECLGYPKFICRSPVLNVTLRRWSYSNRTNAFIGREGDPRACALPCETPQEIATCKAGRGPSPGTTLTNTLILDFWTLEL